MADRLITRIVGIENASSEVDNIMNVQGVAQGDINVEVLDRYRLLVYFWNAIPVVSTDGTPTVEFEYGSEEPDWTTYVTVTDGDHATGHTLTVDASQVDMDTVGTFDVVFTATDSAGNVSDAHTIEITIVDTTVPVITSANANVNTSDASTWTPTYSATDGYDGDITADVVITYFANDGTTPIADLATARTTLLGGDNVKTKANVDDASGNSAVEVVTTYTAVDDTLPVITLTATTVDVAAADVAAWTPATNIASATDNVDGDVSSSVTYTYYEDTAAGSAIADLAAARTHLGTEGNVVYVEYDVDDTATNSAATVSATFTAVADPA